MIVVTGGAGFIGSNIVHGLNRNGEDDIVVVDDLTDGHKHRNLQSANFTDFLDKDDFLEVLEHIGKPAAVFHQGACSDTTEHNGRRMMADNFDYSKTLLTYCAKHDIPFIYASSAAIYGTGKHGFLVKSECERPLNVYGFSKMVFDKYVRHHFEEFSMPVVGLRYFNVYGPREGHKGNMSSVVLKLYEQNRNSRPMTLFEGSDQFRRDFVYVDDVVDVNFHLLEARSSGIVNVGTGEARSFMEMGDVVCAQLPGANIDAIPMPESLVGQYQDYTCADISDLRNLGYTKSFSDLETGVPNYINWLKAEEA